MKRLLFSIILLFPVLTWGYNFNHYYGYYGGGYGGIEAVPNAPVEGYYNEYPSSVVRYDSTQTIEVPANQPYYMTTFDHGEPHRLRYYNGWWYDYDTGTGFPARMQ